MLDDCASFPIIALCLSYNKYRAKNLSEQMFANILHSRVKSSIFKTNKHSSKFSSPVSSLCNNVMSYSQNIAQISEISNLLNEIEKEEKRKKKKYVSL